MIQRKRERNKLAARRKRERKKQRLENLEARKVELEHRRLTLRAELRARRRVNWLMSQQLHTFQNVDGQTPLPRFTPTDSSESPFSDDSLSVDDYNGPPELVASTSYAHKITGKSSVPGTSNMPFVRSAEEVSPFGIELDKLREEVQIACNQAVDTIDLLGKIREELSEVMDGINDASRHRDNEDAENTNTL
ncbi:hypothetical protein H4S08_004240 [Coemansia sp. RSA 1365]|nr:hypothetical protein H4S08_004240 [Coemansia sp. RSA 1365]